MMMEAIGLLGTSSKHPLAAAMACTADMAESNLEQST